MSDDQTKLHDELMERFIQLANNMKDEGVPPNVVSWALMTSSSVYATYALTGTSNNGGLAPSGVEKVAAAYKQILTNVQSMRFAADSNQDQ